MMVGVTSYALYQELAGWWPLISPAAEYAEDAEMVTAVFGSAAGPFAVSWTWAAAAAMWPCT